jgi:hypothetical protein
MEMRGRLRTHRPTPAGNWVTCRYTRTSGRIKLSMVVNGTQSATQTRTAPILIVLVVADAPKIVIEYRIGNNRNRERIYIFSWQIFARSGLSTSQQIIRRGHNKSRTRGAFALYDGVNIVLFITPRTWRRYYLRRGEFNF